MSDPQAMQNHPDAALLAAFAERALTPPERAVLATHLAVCARCRDVVFLAQQAVPDQPAQAAQPASRPRVRLWQPLAAAGFAAILLSVVSFAWLSYLHRGEPGKTGISLAQRAPVPPPTPPTPATPAASHAAAAPAPVASQHTATAHRLPGPAPAPGRFELNTANLPAVGSSALLGSSAPALAAAAPLPEPSPAVAPVRPIPSEQIELQRQVVARQQAATQPTSEGLIPSTMETSARSAPGKTAMRAAAILPPQAEAASAAVFRAAPVPPGGFTPASRLEIQGRILVLDPSGALFAFDDSGQNWRALQSPCAGPAMSLAILPVTAPRAAAASGAAAASPSASTPAMTAASKPAQAPSPATVSLVCASGARWTSQDRGDTWQPAAGKPAAPHEP